MAIIKKHVVYLASFLKEDTNEYGDPVNIYDTPIQFESTLNSLNGSTDIAVYGDKICRMCKTLLDYDDWINKIKEKDVVYLYGITPNGEENNGDNANYKVVAVLPQNLKIMVYFERIV
ncbi:MAG: hypothetical protein ACLUVC_02145 [Longibaculum sp.]